MALITAGYLNPFQSTFASGEIEFTDAGEKRHVTFEDTVYGPAFEPLMEALAKDGWAPRIICESDGTQPEDAKAMKDLYERMLQK